MVECGILCALVLTEKGKAVVVKYESEADKHKALKDWLESESTVIHHPKSKTKKHYNRVKTKKRKGNPLKKTNTALTNQKKWWLTLKKDDEYRK